MNPITLERTGRPALTFEGRLLGFVSSENKENPQKFERWYEIGLYETSTMEFIAYVAYCTTWPSEQLRHTESMQAKTLSLLFEALAAYDPCKHCLLRPERNEDERRRNGKRNFSTKQGLIQSFQKLTQEAAVAINYLEQPHLETRASQTLLHIWLSNDLLSTLDQKRGTRSLEEITTEALRAWCLA